MLMRCLTADPVLFTCWHCMNNGTPASKNKDSIKDILRLGVMDELNIKFFNSFHLQKRQKRSYCLCCPFFIKLKQLIFIILITMIKYHHGRLVNRILLQFGRPVLFNFITRYWPQVEMILHLSSIKWVKPPYPVNPFSHTH